MNIAHSWRVAEWCPLALLHFPLSCLLLRKIGRKATKPLFQSICCGALTVQLAPFSSFNATGSMTCSRLDYVEGLCALTWRRWNLWDLSASSCSVMTFAFMLWQLEIYSHRSAWWLFSISLSLELHCVQKLTWLLFISVWPLWCCMLPHLISLGCTTYIKHA